MISDFEEKYRKRDLVSFILNVGEARQTLNNLLEHDLFNPDFSFSIESSRQEFISQLLEINSQLSFIRSHLYEIAEKLE